MRYPFLNVLRYAQLIYGMSIILGGFFIAVNVAFNNPLTFFNDNYLETVQSRVFAFTSSYLAFCLFSLLSLAIGDFIKMMMDMAGHLEAMRNDSRILVADEVVRDELVQSQLYLPLAPRWYERVGDAILNQINSEALNTQAPIPNSNITTSPINIEPDEAEIDHLYQSGVSAYKSGNYSRAMMLFEEVLQHDPQHINAQKGLRASQKKLG